MLRIFLIAAFSSFLAVFLLNVIFPLRTSVDYSTVITDNKGDVIHAFLTADDKWRMQTALEEISPLLRKTIIAKEDRFFYYHQGINPIAILRAACSNIIHMKRTSGASTITMQVVRALERRPRSYENKLIEIFRAWQLEMKYNKNEILALYCNLLPYGGNIEGVKAASLLYFKKNPDHLSLAEITALAIIPNRPSSLVPGKNNDQIVIQRNRWLRIFEKNKVFTSRHIANALSEPFDVRRGTIPRYAPHASLLLKKGGDPLVHSTIDINMQLKAEKMVQDYTRSLKLKNINNAAVVIIDNRSNKVVTLVGSSNFSDTLDGGQVNGVIATRQPGSTLKPLLYAMCIDEGLITPKKVITDVNINYAGYSPENYDKKYNGYVTMELALGQSLNIPAVKMLKQLGKDKFIRSLATCDFSQVRKDEKKLGLSVILGGCGSSLLELTGLYSAFANGGRYVRPALTMENRSSTSFQVISTGAAFMINEILSNVNRPDFPVNWQSTERMPKIAWKTGTSYGRRDAWSIGYNKRYTVGIWAGNFSGQGVTDLSGADIATPLLFRIFNTIDYDSDEEWFDRPDDCDIRIVCFETGMPPAGHCTNKVTDYFIPTITSTTICDNMNVVMVSADEKISYCKSCAPLNGYKKKLFRKVAPEMQLYFDENSIAYTKIPVHNGECEQEFTNERPSIVSPRSDFEYLISKRDPEPLKLQCRTGNDVSRIFWYIDNQFYKSAHTHSPIYFMPPEGPVKVSCTDDKGRNRDVWIKVKYIEL